MSLIMGDYVAGFLGLGEGNAWNMNAFDVSTAPTTRVDSRGIG
jgi:linoleate 10R-lipoxygenase